MLFGSRKINTEIILRINDVKIENTLLGVILDHKICWKHIRAKVARSTGFLGKARYILNEKAMYI